MDKIREYIIIGLLVILMVISIVTCVGVYDNNVIVDPQPTQTVEPSVEPTPVITVEPTPVPTIVPTPIPTEVPVVRIPDEELPPMASIGFNLNMDLTNALPLYVNNKDIIALKMPKIDGWIWKIASAKNVSMVMPYPEYFIIVCSLSNTETYASFEMVNEDGIVGMTIDATFAVAIGD